MKPSPYVNFTNEWGLPGVKVRKWHPAIFVPQFRYWFRYWRGAISRYKSYERALADITKTLENYTELGCFDIEDITRSIECGYACDFDSEYGFVPEDGCPVHDV